MVAVSVFFYIFATLAVVGALMVINSSHPVHAVLWLIFVFLNSAGLMILIGGEFIALMLIIVYIGAVAVLFLFVVMMLDIDHKTYHTLQQHKGLAFIIASLFFVDLICMLMLMWRDDVLITKSLLHPVSPELQTNIAIGSTQAIGQTLYTEFILPFQTSGLILFVAMIASIALTHRSRPGVKRQNAATQLARNPNNSLTKATLDGRNGLDNIDYDN